MNPQLLYRASVPLARLSRNVLAARLQSAQDRQDEAEHNQILAQATIGNPSFAVNVIVNRSDSTVYAKGGESELVTVIPPRSWYVESIDGVATHNQSRGKFAKCSDYNVIWIHDDGDVTCFGPRTSFPFAGTEPEWLNDAPDTGWNNLKSVADQIDAMQSGDDGDDADTDHEIHGASEIEPGGYTGDVNIDPEIGRTA